MTVSIKDIAEQFDVEKHFKEIHLVWGEDGVLRLRVFGKVPTSLPGVALVIDGVSMQAAEESLEPIKALLKAHVVPPLVDAYGVDVKE